MEKSDNRHWKLNLAMMWFSQLVVLTGFAAAMPFIPLFFKHNVGITDEGELGIYVSLFNFFSTLAYAIGNPLWGTLSDRWGVKIMLLRGTFVTAFIFPIMGYVHSAWLLIGLRFLTAFCAGTTSAAQTLIVKNTPDNKLGLALGIFSTAYFCGIMLGNVVGGLVVHYYGFESAFWFCGILYFIGGISVIFAREDCKPAPKIKNSVQRRSRVKPIVPLLPVFTTAVTLALLLFMINGFVRTFEGAYIAMLVEIITGPDTAAYWTGIVSAFASGGALLSGALFGYLADRYPPEKLVLPALLTAAVMLFLQAGAESVWAFGASRTFMAITGGGLGPIYQKVLSNITPRRKRGQVFGWTSTFSGIGNMSSSLVAGWFIMLFGTRGVFYVGALLTLLLVPIMQIMLKKILDQPYYKANAGKNRKK